MMEKIWFAVIEGKSEGPLDLAEYKRLGKITPETFVWKEGMLQWKRIRELPELSYLFSEVKPKDEPSPSQVDELKPTDEEIAMRLEDAEPPNSLWILIFIMVITYLMYRAYWS